MPRRKTEKPIDVWVIKCDGLKVWEAPTEAEAKTRIKLLEKSVPSYINFSFDVVRQQNTHITTA